MKKSDELKQQVKPNQINYTLIALDLLAGISNGSNYIRHKDIVEVGNKIREMVSTESFFNDETDVYKTLIKDMVAHIVEWGSMTYGEYVDKFRDRVKELEIL